MEQILVDPIKFSFYRVVIESFGSIFVAAPDLVAAYAVADNYRSKFNIPGLITHVGIEPTVKEVFVYYA